MTLQGDILYIHTGEWRTCMQYMRWHIWVIYCSNNYIYMYTYIYKFAVCGLSMGSWIPYTGCRVRCSRYNSLLIYRAVVCVTWLLDIGYFFKGIPTLLTEGWPCDAVVFKRMLNTTYFPGIKCWLYLCGYVWIKLKCGHQHLKLTLENRHALDYDVDSLWPSDAYRIHLTKTSLVQTLACGL